LSRRLACVARKIAVVPLRTPTFDHDIPVPEEHRQSKLLNVPSYSAPEAARILALSVSTVRNWSFGQSGKLWKRQQKRFASVIQAGDPERRLLSFANLCELHVLSAIRHEHKISLQNVRRSLEFVARRMGVRRPLLDTEFSTNGVSLFVEHAAQLVNVSREGQIAMRGEFERALARIQRDNRGTPVRLFPFSRLGPTDADQPRHIAIDPAIAFGRPMLVRAGVRTEVVIARFTGGDAPAEMAQDYGVTEDEILEALRYEQRWAKAA
jgi:uncharacterized protein (DUF433 family)